VGRSPGRRSTVSRQIGGKYEGKVIPWLHEESSCKEGRDRATELIDVTATMPQPAVERFNTPGDQLTQRLGNGRGPDRKKWRQHFDQVLGTRPVS